ncbi:MAG: hypothetical protein Ct9H90mP16_18560 [Candidatus Poseidoniales archaeon]|nr:MAG: hypothetical protein Ct9H90mP16_18560 [Candidatus Poseidoniales archaeon]
MYPFLAGAPRLRRNWPPIHLSIAEVVSGKACDLPALEASVGGEPFVEMHHGSELQELLNGAKKFVQTALTPQPARLRLASSNLS